MLDWLSSKFAMMVAALLILASAFALLGIQRSGYEDAGLKAVADEIADGVNYVSRLNAEARAEMNLGGNDSGGGLPSKINGKAYSVNLSGTGVLVTQETKGALAHFSSRVHAWNPAHVDLGNETAVGKMDDKVGFVLVDSGARFVIESRMMEKEDGNGFEVFVYEG